jgi:subtilisin-like proprotein convertase family protein/subtilisin family serine protease
MRKVAISVLFCLLALVAVWLFWPTAKSSAPLAKSPAAPSAPNAAAVAPTTKKTSASSHAAITRSSASTNRESFRLSNTTKKVDELVTVPHAILLENAFVDTDAHLGLSIPKHLRASGEPGAYIVQAHGPVDAAFRAALVAAGGHIISYIPNNAYLVQLSGAGAGTLSGSSQVQAVLPYEPYYKLQSSLLGQAVAQEPLPEGQVLTIGLFASGADVTVQQIEKLGGKILASDRSPFGPVVRVRPATDWLALAQLPGVLRVEPATRRQLANDLARVTMGISVDTVTNANWRNLTGANVIVDVNDSGIDATHPDLTGRVTGDNASSLTDTDGHGTHVAGIIAGDGSMSSTLSANPPSGSVTNADFRGKAALKARPSAKLFSVGFLGQDTNTFISDQFLQEQAALTNALISNNSWGSSANEYDLSSASYDAAVRDALTGVTGPQPVLFVFAAGNSGAGDDNGGGGIADSVNSPGTAKNVITVGALEQFRNITNVVTLLDGTSNAVWQAQTDSSTEVAGYSARGNVGIGTEGPFGRFKPDVVAPGTFVVSTRSQQWDQAKYFNPTNTHSDNSQPGVTVGTNQLVFGSTLIPENAVGLTISVQPNTNSLRPFPQNFPIYFSQSNNPGPTNNQFSTTNNVLSIPPGGGSVTGISNLLGTFVNFSVGNPTNQAISFDLIVQVTTTNDNGNQLTVMSNLDNSIGPWYRYETGTSMATPAVSGALALMQDFFTNTLHALPSPALLKAMLINGSRLTAGYNTFNINTNINFEGWGLVSVPNSLPLGLSSTNTGTNGASMFFIDQSPTNVLATGDSRTFNVNVPSTRARAQTLHITLAWTDPPGNPASAIKLVNNLDLVVSNRDNGRVFYGNNFDPAATTPASIGSTNGIPVLDSINNVESVWLPAPLATNYSVTVVGRNVTVNAVTAEQTNIVQDFALVVSCGDSANTNGIVVTTSNTVSAITPQITYLSSFTNGINYGQISGANAPWLSTNTLALPAQLGFGTNASLQIGQTNQWRFFIVTNTTQFSNAAFVIFNPQTLSVPRMGVFANSPTNATTPEADLNLFVAGPLGPNSPALTNLDQMVISNCVFNTNGDQSSLGRGGTKFLVFPNSQSNQVYYVGVQCEGQTGGEFGFLANFTDQLSQNQQNGNQDVFGMQLPALIPDGNNTHPGVVQIIALAVNPMTVLDVTVTNTITHQNYGDLIGGLTHSSKGVVLNNHDGLGGGTFTQIYNDNGLPGARGTDGPGSLKDFRGVEASGPWILTEVDNSPGNIGFIDAFALNIHPHIDLAHGLANVFVPAGSCTLVDFVDVPVGTTNIMVLATNITAPPQLALNPPVEIFLNFESELSGTNFVANGFLTNTTTGLLPSGVISFGPPLEPGRYFITLCNPSAYGQNVQVAVKLSQPSPSAIKTVDYPSTGPVPLLDDAVTNSSILVTNADVVQDFSVGLRMDHQRISDLVVHLISPDGTRYLLMENRGGQTTNGCGLTVITSNNIANVTADGTTNSYTNSFVVNPLSGTLPIRWDFFNVPDQMTVYSTTNPADFTANFLLFDTGMVSGSGQTNLVYATTTGLTIIMNQFGNTNAGGDQWTFTAGGVFTNFAYLAFTENTNLTTTPIKYAVPPLVPATQTVITNGSTNIVATNLYYLPEQDISGIKGSSPFGPWTLEVLDNRAGASINSSLVSWDLNFTFANTNFVPSITPPIINTNGGTVTNVIPPFSVEWIQVFVPTNADIATNTLVSSTQPVNLLVNLTAATNGAVTLLSNVTNGIVNLATNSTPPLVPGGFYFLGVQNPGGINATSVVSVTFHLIPAPPSVVTQPATGATGASATLNASVTPNGFPTTVFFEYGTDTNYGLTSTSVTLTNNLNLGQAVGIGVTGLEPSAVYHFQAVAANAAGTNFGGDRAFLTASIIRSITLTNSGGSNAFLLTWFAPSNDTFSVQWTTNIANTNWQTFTNIVSFNPNFPATATNATFTFLDDGSQPVGLTPIKFYRLILLPFNKLTFQTPTNFTVNVGTTAIATNIATDSDPAAVIMYSLISAPAGAVIDTNGVITWPNASPAGLAARFITLATDNGLPQATATNAFTIFVEPLPSISGVKVTSTNILLTWSAPTNDLFNIRWATNLAPPINWILFSNGVAPFVVSSTNGVFSFTDTNTTFLMKFYQLILLP